MVGISARIAHFALPALLSASLISGSARAAETISEQDAHAIGVQAYLYFYSLVTMDLTRKQLTNIVKPAGLYGPMNTFANISEYPTAETKVVVRPNFDTLYSSAWLDLTKEPVIVSVPDKTAPEDALKLMAWKLASVARVVNGWSMNTDTMGVYGNYYLKRAIITQLGLGANLPEDAIYPINLADETGKPLDGGSDYVLHFEGGDAASERLLVGHTV
jgi:hypothetical protein